MAIWIAAEYCTKMISYCCLNFITYLQQILSFDSLSQFQVCCNHEPHLRGNVYVQYQNEHEAVKAYAKFNGRFYAGRQISCEFVKIEKWKSAICGELRGSGSGIAFVAIIVHCRRFLLANLELTQLNFIGDFQLVALVESK